MRLACPRPCVTCWSVLSVLHGVLGASLVGDGCMQEGTSGWRHAFFFIVDDVSKSKCTHCLLCGCMAAGLMSFVRMEGRRCLCCVSTWSRIVGFGGLGAQRFDTDLRNVGSGRACWDPSYRIMVGERNVNRRSKLNHQCSKHCP